MKLTRHSQRRNCACIFTATMDFSRKVYSRFHSTQRWKEYFTQSSNNKANRFVRMRRIFSLLRSSWSFTRSLGFANADSGKIRIFCLRSKSGRSLEMSYGGKFLESEDSTSAIKL